VASGHVPDVGYSVYQGHTGLTAVDEQHTTAVVQRYLNELGDDTPTEPVIRGLMDRATSRLQLLCRHLLYRSYPRLTRPPLNLEADELLSAVVERLLKSLRTIRPKTVRQFFALANQHIRWELNDLARRLDQMPSPAELRDSVVPGPASSASLLSPVGRRMLEAIENLPAEEQEVFGLVRIQGLTQAESATILGVSTKTVQRRLNRSLMLLAKQLRDLEPCPRPAADTPGDGTT
jgi:RNA polymerase sigma factor (sigma-70 family)